MEAFLDYCINLDYSWGVHVSVGLFIFLILSLVFTIQNLTDEENKFKITFLSTVFIMTLYFIMLFSFTNENRVDSTFVYNNGVVEKVFTSKYWMLNHDDIDPDLLVSYENKTFIYYISVNNKIVFVDVRYGGDVPSVVKFMKKVNNDVSTNYSIHRAIEAKILSFSELCKKKVCNRDDLTKDLEDYLEGTGLRVYPWTYDIVLYEEKSSFTEYAFAGTKG